MSAKEKITSQSDSLIELLTAQCGDLENLLALARAENAAVKRGDFGEILRIITERDSLSLRLETFQRQIGELRGFLETQNAVPKQNEITARIIEIANLTLAQDRETKKLLTAARKNAATELQNTEKAARGTNAYLKGGQKGLAYTRNF